LHHYRPDRLRHTRGVNSAGMFTSTRTDTSW
jgi:hypothetical protein